MVMEISYRFTKIGLVIKGLLNLFVFGLFLFLLPEKYFPFLGFFTSQIIFLRLIGLIAIVLGLIYIWSAFDIKNRKTIAKIIYLDSLIYPIALLIVALFVPLPWSAGLSGILVGIVALILLIGKSHEILF